MFKKSVNMLERMEIAESIYKDLVETSYKKTTQAYSNRAGRSRNKRRESTTAKTHPVTG